MVEIGTEWWKAQLECTGETWTGEARSSSQDEEDMGWPVTVFPSEKLDYATLKVEDVEWTEGDSLLMLLFGEDLIVVGVLQGETRFARRREMEISAAVHGKKRPPAPEASEA